MDEKGDKIHLSLFFFRAICHVMKGVVA